jgi:sporulation protein YlmC with PRC-barrel domain
MSYQTVHLEDLLGRKVFDPNGRCAGRIEEVIVRQRDGKYVVTEIHLGRRALAERLSIQGISMSFVSFLGASRHPASHKAKWEQVDLTDPRRPRLTCAIEQLEEI